MFMLQKSVFKRQYTTANALLAIGSRQREQTLSPLATCTRCGAHQALPLLCVVIAVANGQTHLHHWHLIPTVR
jgi:hypothetical protein